METGKIPDNKISAKTEGSNTTAKNGRLHYTSGSSWCASTNTDQYLQLDLGTTYVICAVATQGNSKAEQWVVTYQLQSSTDGTTWTDYKEGGQVRVSTDLPHIMKLWPFRISMNQSNGMELWRKREIMFLSQPTVVSKTVCKPEDLDVFCIYKPSNSFIISTYCNPNNSNYDKITRKAFYFVPGFFFSYRFHLYWIQSAMI